jgi:hypothetical protein
MGVVENIKDVAELVKKFNDIELNRRILDLENEVLDLSRAKCYAEERVEELERTLAPVPERPSGLNRGARQEISPSMRRYCTAKTGEFSVAVAGGIWFIMVDTKNAGRRKDDGRSHNLRQEEKRTLDITTCADIAYPGILELCHS